MLGYMFDPNYKKAKNDYNSAKSNKKKLERIKNDITNDTSSINAINKKLGYIYEDFAKAVLTSNVRNRVSTKLNALKEPYQTSDGDLISAKNEIDEEIRLMDGKMTRADNLMEKVKRQQNGSW